MTRADITRRELAKAKPSKYRNKKTSLDGMVFDSAKEARRYQELVALGHLGRIRNLELQPWFWLMVCSTGVSPGVRVAKYVADFRYEERVAVLDQAIGWRVDWQDVVEDVKGMKTPIYRLKKKLFEAIYHIQIREI